MILPFGELLSAIRKSSTVRHLEIKRQQYNTEIMVFQPKILQNRTFLLEDHIDDEMLLLMIMMMVMMNDFL